MVNIGLNCRELEIPSSMIVFVLKTEIGMSTYDFDSLNNSKEQLKEFLS